jgi:hypothetical protein
MSGASASHPSPGDDEPRIEPEADASVDRLHASLPSAARDRARRLNCPHCGGPIQLVEPQCREVTCTNCGSSFQIDVAFGEVYQAHDHQLDRVVAVKIPRVNCFATQEDEQRFMREARSAAGLRHSSIVQVHEVSRDGELLSLGPSKPATCGRFKCRRGVKVIIVIDGTCCK